MVLQLLQRLEIMAGHGDCHWGCNPLSRSLQSSSRCSFLVSGSGLDSNLHGNCTYHGGTAESPRVLIRKGDVAAATDVVDMLSLEEDPVKRAQETVRIHPPVRALIRVEMANTHFRRSALLCQLSRQLARRSCKVTPHGKLFSLRASRDSFNDLFYRHSS